MPVVFSGIQKAHLHKNGNSNSIKNESELKVKGVALLTPRSLTQHPLINIKLNKKQQVKKNSESNMKREILMLSGRQLYTGFISSHTLLPSSTNCAKLSH